MQQFRDEVRNSPEVKFAVQAFTAVSSNNFVRFFKLVKGASYLASCLLHRYFNQVRNCVDIITEYQTSIHFPCFNALLNPSTINFLFNIYHIRSPIAPAQFTMISLLMESLLFMKCSFVEFLNCLRVFDSVCPGQSEGIEDPKHSTHCWSPVDYVST